MRRVCVKDHPEVVQKVTKLLVKLVKHNPDLRESTWQYNVASMLPGMMLRLAVTIDKETANH